MAMPLVARITQPRLLLFYPFQAAFGLSPSPCCSRTNPSAIRKGRVSVPLPPYRPLHLYKTARAKTTLGQHKVLTFNTYEVASPSASQHTVKLVGSKGQEIASDITLQELYDNHVKSGHMLYLTESVKKGKAQSLGKLQADAPADMARTFSIVKAHSTHAQLSKKDSSKTVSGQFGPLKTLNFTLSSPPLFVQIQLDRAYRFIEAHSPVEVRIRFAGTKLTKAARLEAGDPGVWPWMHDHFPHLRPDFILRGMPPGTFFLIPPVTDNRIVQFVMTKESTTMPRGDLLQRLFKVKASVQQSIKAGRQAQLPALMRQQLHDSGQSEYVTTSGLPRPRMKEKYGFGHSSPFAEEKDEDGQADVSEGRYLFPSSKMIKRQQLARYMEKQGKKA